jgi:hypothetical protein
MQQHVRKEQQNANNTIGYTRNVSNSRESASVIRLILQSTCSM